MILYDFAFLAQHEGGQHTRWCSSEARFQGHLVRRWSSLLHGKIRTFYLFLFIYPKNRSTQVGLLSVVMFLINDTVKLACGLPITSSLDKKKDH